MDAVIDPLKCPGCRKKINDGSRNPYCKTHKQCPLCKLWKSRIDGFRPRQNNCAGHRKENKGNRAKLQELALSCTKCVADQMSHDRQPHCVPCDRIRLRNKKKKKKKAKKNRRRAKPPNEPNSLPESIAKYRPVEFDPSEDPIPNVKGVYMIRDKHNVWGWAYIGTGVRKQGTIRRRILQHRKTLWFHTNAGSAYYIEIHNVAEARRLESILIWACRPRHNDKNMPSNPHGSHL